MKAKDFWQRVRSQIREKQVSQTIVANYCGVPLSTFRRWINNNIIPPLDVAFALSKYFGKSLDYLTSGKEADLIAEIRGVLDTLYETNKKHKAMLRVNNRKRTSPLTSSN